MGLFRFNLIRMYFLYIIYSAKLDKYYVGSTANINERISKHNTNHKGFTGTVNDWILKYYEEFSTKTEALKRELQIKKWKSSVRIKNLIAGSEHPDL